VATACAAVTLAWAVGRVPSWRLAVDALSLLLVSAVLAPVLGTLTSEYAGNTVQALVAASFLVHMYATDLRHDVAPVSMNAALAAVLLLSSRYRSGVNAFAFGLACALVIVTAQTRRASPLVSSVLFVSALAATWAFCSPAWALAMVQLAWFLAVPCCAVLDRAMASKTRLAGPWDQLRVEEEEERGVELTAETADLGRARSGSRTRSRSRSASPRAPSGVRTSFAAVTSR